MQQLVLQARHFPFHSADYFQCIPILKAIGAVEWKRSGVGVGCETMQQLGGSGGMPLRKCLEFRCSEIASETISGQNEMMTDFPFILQVSTCGVSPAKRTLCACGPSVSVR